MNLKQTGKPLVLSLMVGLMFLLTACPSPTTPSTPPTAANDTYDVVEGQPRTVAAPGVLSNDGGEDLQAALVTNVAAGTLNLETNGSFTYTPTGAAGTTDSFTYRATNSVGESEPATVTINIVAPPGNGGDPMPGTLTAQDDALPRVAPGGTLNFTEAQLMQNDTVPMGVEVEFELNEDSLTGGGTLTDNDDDTYTYTAPAAPANVTFTYTLSVDDDAVADSTATVMIPVADAPMPGTGPYNVNFQNQAATTPADYFADYGQPYGQRSGPNQGTGQTYGWVTIVNNMATQAPCDLTDDPATPAVDGNGRERGQDSAIITQLLDTFMHMQGADVAANNSGNFTGVKQNCAWQIAVPNGTYNVVLALGDAVDERNTSVSAVTAYQVSVESVVFPDPAYVPPATAGDGSIEQFAITPQPLSVNVTDGLLTVTPTGTNTKIAYITITAQ